MNTAAVQQKVAKVQHGIFDVLTWLEWGGVSKSRSKKEDEFSSNSLKLIVFDDFFSQKSRKITPEILRYLDYGIYTTSMRASSG